MSGVPAAAAKGERDTLGRSCFVLHLAIMMFIVSGWALPIPVLLAFYLVFLPAVVLQWQFNKNSCVLNNIESLLRSGHWRNAGNPEEGAWLQGLVRSVLGLEIRPARLDAFVRTVLVVFWGAGLAHLLRG